MTRPSRSRAEFGPRLQRVLVQPMLADGVEVMIGVVQEPVFGPLVVSGPVR
jgi:acyl-CoA synthetase (NDP forming)